MLGFSPPILPSIIVPNPLSLRTSFRIVKSYIPDRSGLSFPFAKKPRSYASFADLKSETFNGSYVNYILGQVNIIFVSIGVNENDIH